MKKNLYTLLEAAFVNNQAISQDFLFWSTCPDRLLKMVRSTLVWPHYFQKINFQNFSFCWRNEWHRCRSSNWIARCNSGFQSRLSLLERTWTIGSLAHGILSKLSNIATVLWQWKRELEYESKKHCCNSKNNSFASNP